jgi:DNA-binding transcriptional LysR family regulator
MRYRLDTRSLQLFMAVAQNLSFRQAAEELHVSQPPLSRAIRQFESRLGAPLFDRSTTEVKLTSLGRALIPQARRILDLTRAAEESLARYSEPARVRLGVTSAVEPQSLHRFIRQARRRRRSVELSTVSATSPQLVRMLRRHKLDAALIALPTESKDLDVTPLYREPLCVCIRSTHPLAARRILRFADLRGLRLFWFERGRNPEYFDYCRQVFAAHGFRPQTTTEPDEHHVLLSEVAEGKAISLLPASFARIRRNGVVYRRLKEGGLLSVGIGLALPLAAHPRLGWLKQVAAERVQP